MKKDIVKDALLIAKQLEIAARKNAQDIVVEAFTPRLMDVVRQTIREEGPGPQLDGPVTKLAKGEEEETESSEVQNDAMASDGYPEGISPTPGEKELKGKGKKHDLDRTAPAPGQMTEGEYEDDMDMEEGEDHDVGKLHFDDRDAGDSEFERGDGEFNESEEIDLDMDPEAGEDEELDIDIGMDEDDDMDLGDMDGEDELDLEEDDLDMDAMDMDAVDPEDDVFEAEDEEGGEELEIPDELFDDADDQEVGGDDEVPMDEDDEELDLDVVDDEDPDMSEEYDEDMMGDEEFEEGLYVRKEGKFEKVDPSQALEARMKDLEEERDKLANALTAMKGQLGEQHLLNVKLVHLVRLYESGQFSSKEKRRIAERLDRCSSPKKVQAVYKSIVAEASERTVLDDVHDVLTEQRVRRTSKPTGETVYESAEVKRMRRLAGLDRD